MHVGEFWFEQPRWDAIPCIANTAERALWECLKGKAPLSTTGEVTFPGWHSLAVIREATSSQFDRLGELSWCVKDGPVAALALSGRGFHGQRARTWHALPGNLHLSSLMPLGMPLASVAPTLMMLPAVAVAEALQQLAPECRPGIKWVNDVLLASAKVAGVLTATTVEHTSARLVRFGIGLNIVAAPDLIPTPFVPRATSIRQQGLQITAAQLVPVLLNRLQLGIERLLAGNTQAIVTAYQRYLVGIGKRVRLVDESCDTITATTPIMAEGIMAGVNPDLTLKLTGYPTSVGRGRLAFVEPE